MQLILEIHGRYVEKTKYDHHSGNDQLKPCETVSDNFGVHSNCMISNHCHRQNLLDLMVAFPWTFIEKCLVQLPFVHLWRIIKSDEQSKMTHWTPKMTFCEFACWIISYVMFSTAIWNGNIFSTAIWNGNIFRVTGPLCGEFTGHRWIPRTKPSDADVDAFFDLRLNKSLSKKSWGW